MLGIGLSMGAFASTTDTYYDQHAKGWHWYDDPAQDKTAPEKVQPVDPARQLSTVRANIKTALAKAIINPTEKNVENYIASQNAMSDRAHQFANTWQKVLLMHPELDYSIQHPTNSNAVKIYYNEQRTAEDNAIAKLAKESGLFFFYKSTCPYCREFAPVVKAFAERYGLSLIPITMDGIALPEFPHSVIDKGQAAQFKVQVEPSLFAVNPYTHKAYPIAYGLVSEAFLRKRIHDIAVNFQGAR
jgi:conjugal transfer pilus assembly protein TraF